VAGMVPAKIIVAALLAFAVTTGAARAEPSEKKCLDVTGFSTNIVGHGGKSTLIPAAGFARAQELLSHAPGHEKVEADQAYFDEMPDGSSGIVFAKGKCVSAILLTPSFVPQATLKAILLNPNPSLPHDTAPGLAGMTDA